MLVRMDRQCNFSSCKAVGLKAGMARVTFCWWTSMFVFKWHFQSHAFAPLCYLLLFFPHWLSLALPVKWRIAAWEGTEEFNIILLMHCCCFVKSLSTTTSVCARGKHRTENLFMMRPNFGFQPDELLIPFKSCMK